MEIWILSLYFNQENSIASERVKRISRHLSRKHKLKVFTIKNQAKNSFDNKNIKILHSKVFFKKYLFRNYNSYKHNQINLNNLFPKIISKIIGDSGWTWFFQLRNLIKKEIEEKGKPELIFASGSPFLPFFLCFLLKRKYKIPYILDYRDAWTRNPNRENINPLFKIFPRIIESISNNYSSGIITVSLGTSRGIISSNKKTVIYNIPDYYYLNNINKIAINLKNNSKKVLTLTLTGTLYPYQNLDTLCKAIKGLKENHRSKVRFEYCGRSWKYVDSIFNKYKISANLKNYKFLNKKEAIKILAKADIALSIISCIKNNQNPIMKGEVTTKVFDYIALGKNILNFSFNGFEILGVLDKIKYKNIVNIEPDNIDKIKNFLEKLIKEKIKYEKIENFGSNKIEGLLKENKNNCKKLDSIIQIN